MKRIKIIKDYYGGKVLYNKGYIDFNPNVLTVLIGCNGAGKTTLLHQIKHHCDETETIYIEFDNLTNGGREARDLAMHERNYDLLSKMVLSSEGENIFINVHKFASEIGKFVSYALENGKAEAWILLDAVDSGFSIDNIVEIKEDLFKTIIEDCKGKIDIYIVASANEFELACNEDCIDVVTGNHYKVTNYNRYKKLIMRSREIKDNRNLKTKNKPVSYPNFKIRRGRWHREEETE